MSKKEFEIMEDYWKDFEIMEKTKNKGGNIFLSNDNVASTLTRNEKIKKIKEDRIKKVKELLDENKSELNFKYTQDAVEKYALINAPIFSKINALRNKELYEIRQLPEYDKFVQSLPDNQRITISGYIISRNKVLITREGLPGFSDEESFDYIYDNPAEDITILFGSKEYSDKIKALKEQIIPWDEFITKYYTV